MYWKEPPVAETGNKRPITVDDLYRITTVEDPRVSPSGEWVAYVVATLDRVENAARHTIWLAPTAGGEPVQVTRSGKDSSPRWSPDGSTLAFVSARGDKPQIYLLPIGAPGGEARALTAMENGASSPAWSPGGTQIAFLAGMNAEERAREDRGEEPLLPADAFEAEQRQRQKEHDEELRWDPRPVDRIPYREGTAFRDDRTAQVYVMAVDEASEAGPRRLTDVDADHAPPEWSAEGTYLFTSRTIDPEADEPWIRSSLYRIRVADGQIEVITDEEHADLAPLPTPHGDLVAYNRVPVEMVTDGLPRLTVVPGEGGPERDLNLEFDRSAEFYRWTPDGESLLFRAPSWGDVGIYRVAAEGGPVEPVATGRREVQSFDVGPDGGVAFAASTPLSPPELFWLPVGADAPTQITHVNRELLDEVIVQDTEEMRFIGPRGHELQGWLILPVGYETGQKVPLALHIHGGPHAMWGPSTRSMWHEWQLHAANGYAVFYTNPRGGDGYGEAFQRELHGAWGDVAFDDIMAGLDALLEWGIIDETRMAVVGGSYGGYMTAWVVGHTDRFACAVTQRGVYNMSSFYGTSDVPKLISGEYSAEPWEDPELLWAHSPLAYAHRITTPLLIIHSEADYRVPIEQAEQLFAFVRRATDTPVKLLRYPRDGHELSRSGEPRHRVSRLTEMVAWFNAYCGAEG
jgi:dipeptidyl aminopeptidase/acylaminoacyl peptidase